MSSLSIYLPIKQCTATYCNIEQHIVTHRDIQYSTVNIYTLFYIIYIGIHMCDIFMHIHIPIHIHTYIHTSMSSIYTYLYIYSKMYVYIFIHLYMHILWSHVHIFVYLLVFPNK